MDESPLASVIISNYNYRFLKRCIESALAQTYANTEVIVVDDGSTDDSQAILVSYGNRVKAIFKENGGQASALNRGFFVSRGKVICFLDSDDELAPGAMEAVVPLFQDQELASWTGPSRLWTQKGTEWVRWWPRQVMHGPVGPWRGSFPSQKEGSAMAWMGTLGPWSRSWERYRKSSTLWAFTDDTMATRTQSGLLLKGCE